MPKLRRLLADYGPLFSHGLIAGVLVVLTLHAAALDG